MSLNPARITAALQADIISKLQAAFPKPSVLQTAESAAIDAEQIKWATALSTAIGPDVVTEVLLATIGGVTPGGGVGVIS